MKTGCFCFWGGEELNVWAGNLAGYFIHNGHQLWCCGQHWKECEAWLESRKASTSIVAEAEKIIKGEAKP